MGLKLPALSCNGAGKLWAAGRRKGAGLAAGGYTGKKHVSSSDGWPGAGEGDGDGGSNVVGVLALREMRRKLDPSDARREVSSNTFTSHAGSCIASRRPASAFHPPLRPIEDGELSRMRNLTLVAVGTVDMHVKLHTCCCVRIVVVIIS
jgi:hypothetical protein